MPDPNPNPVPAPDPNAPPADPDPTDDPNDEVVETEPETDPEETTETETREPDAIDHAWCWLVGHRVGVLVTVLVLIILGVVYTNLRVNRRTATAREEKLYRIQNQAGIADHESRIGKLEGRVTKLEADVEGVKIEVRSGFADMKEFLKQELGKDVSSATDETEEPVAEPAEPEEPVARAAVTPRTPTKAPAKTAAKPTRKTARTARSEPSEAPAQARAAAPTKRGPANEDELLARARAQHGRMGRTLAAARAIHENTEALVDEVVGDEESLTAEDAAAVEEHRRLYRPAVLRPTAWRDVRPDETCVVHVGGR